MASKISVLSLLLSSATAAELSYSMSTQQCLLATKTMPDPDDATGETTISVPKLGQYCLKAGSWTEGQCCDTSVDISGEDVPDLCKVAPQWDTANT